MTPMLSLSLVCHIHVSRQVELSPAYTATKCDDISCSEVVRALALDEDPELQEIEDEIRNCKDDADEWKGKKTEAEAAARGLLLPSVPPMCLLNLLPHV